MQYSILSLKIIIVSIHNLSEIIKNDTDNCETQEHPFRHLFVFKRKLFFQMPLPRELFMGG